MAKSELTFKIHMVPDDETMNLVLALLDMWQNVHPDQMVAMVPDRDKYRYEIISRRDRGTEDGMR